MRESKIRDKMHFKSQDIEIEPSNPFDNDLFALEKYAQVLTQIVNASEDSFTLSIDATWGMGKTTFVNMWRQSLENDGLYTIYVNAWESDFVQDPMMALVDSIAQSIKLHDSGNKVYEILSPIVDELIRIVKRIPSISLAGKVAEVVKQILDSTKGDRNILEEHQTYVSIVEQFKRQLVSFTENLPNKKMVIFVDELDRCRPDYSIEMLERIKHLFSIPNTIFVLSIDRTIVLESIKGFYNSSNVNAENYLRRFIDLSFSLPQPSMSAFVSAQYAYHQLDQCEDSYQNYVNRTYDRRDRHTERLKAITKCLSVHNRNLRDVEKFFNLLDITFHSVRIDISNMDLIVWLVYIKMFEPDVYEILKSPGRSEMEILSILESRLYNEQVNFDLDINIYWAYIIIILSESYKLEYHAQEMSDDERKNFQFQNIKIKDFRNLYNGAYSNVYHCSLSYIMRQIELIDSNFKVATE